MSDDPLIWKTNVEGEIKTSLHDRLGVRQIRKEMGEIQAVSGNKKK